MVESNGRAFVRKLALEAGKLMKHFRIFLKQYPIFACFSIFNNMINILYESGSLKLNFKYKIIIKALLMTFSHIYSI